VGILDNGSYSPLQLRAEQVESFVYIHLYPVWIRSTENSVANELSGCTVEVDCNDWQLQSCWFLYLDIRFDDFHCLHF